MYEGYAYMYILADCLIVIPPQQNSRASLPPPRLSRETSMANPIHGSQQEPRDWQQETAYVDFDSDDSLEEGSPGQPSSRHGAGFNNRAFRKSAFHISEDFFTFLDLVFHETILLSIFCNNMSLFYKER